MAMRPEISVTPADAGLSDRLGVSDKSIRRTNIFRAPFRVIEELQVEQENLYAEGLGLPDGEEVDHLDDPLRADGRGSFTVWKETLPDPVVSGCGVRQREAGRADASGDGSQQHLVDMEFPKRSTPTWPKTSTAQTQCSFVLDIFGIGKGTQAMQLSQIERGQLYAILEK